MEETRRRTALRVAKRTRFLFERQHTVEVEAKVGVVVRENIIMVCANPPTPLHRSRYQFAVPSPAEPNIATDLPLLPPSA